jgi:drug/metabolite transporter (DMT)-like permease
MSRLPAPSPTNRTDAALNRVLLGAALVAGGAALFGTLGYISRSAGGAGVDSLAFVAWRAAIGTAVLLVAGFILGSRAGAGRLPDPRVMPRDRQIALLVASILGALLNIAMFAAFARTTIAVALLCFYTYPALVTLAATRLYGERLGAVRLGALVLSSIGLVLVVLAPLVGSANVVVDPGGVALALGAALCQCSFILIAGRGFEPLSSLHVSTLVIVAAAVVSVPLALVIGDASSLLVPLSHLDAWPWILAGSITGAAIPTTAFLTGIGLIGPSRAAMLMTIEPLVGVALAALLLGEKPAPIQVLGGVAVLAAAAILQIAPRTRVVPQPEFGPLV